MSGESDIVVNLLIWVNIVILVKLVIMVKLVILVNVVIFFKSADSGENGGYCDYS